MEEEGDGSCGVMVLEGGGDEVAVDEGSSGISGRDKPSEAALTAAALLIRAVRRCDEAEVARLVAGGMDVNAEVEVEGAEFVPQEELLYPSTALLEAARTRHLPVLAAVLAAPGIDVNCRTTHMGMTPFADACFRGDAEMAGVLMRDSRVDVALGDSIMPHPAVYACITGCIPVLKLFADAGLLGDDLEALLMDTAAANAQPDVVTFVRNYYIDRRPLHVLAGEAQADKIRRVAARHGATAAGTAPAEALPAIADALGAALSSGELGELRATLTADGLLSPAGKLQFRVEALVDFWLGRSGSSGSSGGSGEA